MDERLELIKEKLSNKRWRLTSGKLYSIKDKYGNQIPFIPNKHQLKLYDALEKYGLIIIPKARQLGFSTAMQIYLVDDFLFRRNFSGGVIANTKENAIDIFDNKIKYAWENFPNWLKYDSNKKPRWIMSTDRANEMSCENTFSKIRVSTSFRGGTLQVLHVSEFGPICAERPLHAKEIVNGAFESVAKGNKIVLESTSAGAEGYFYEIAMLAKAIEDQGREPEMMEWKLLFFPWWEEEEYAIDINAEIPGDMAEYFDDLEKNHNIHLTRQQKLWYCKKREVKGDDMRKEYPSTFEECFALILEGTYYERELKAMRRDRRICKVAYDPSLQVHTAWDLGGAGGGDDTSIWFFQIYGSEVRFIDYWEGNGVSMIWVMENVIKGRYPTYGTHFAPHDIQVHEYSTGESRWETARKNGLRFEVLPQTAISDGINTTRQLFKRFYMDEAKCDEGIKRVGNYRRSWNEKLGIHMDTPMKNGAQHAADALRYAAQGISRMMNFDGGAVISDMYMPGNEENYEKLLDIFSENNI